MSLAARQIDEGALERMAAQAPMLLYDRYGVSVGSGEGGSLLSHFYAAYQLLRPVHSETLKSVGSASERIVAADAYALGVAAAATLGDALEKVPSDGYKVSFSVASMDASSRERLILHDGLQRHERIAKERPSYDKVSAEQFLKAIYREANRTVERISAEVQLAVDRSPISLEGVTYRGLSSSSHMVEETPLDPGVEIVGNSELMAGMRRTLRLLLSYDPLTGRNPYIEAGLVIPRTALVAGPPGTGKSTSVNQLFAWAKAESEREGLAPVYIHRIDNSSKSELQNSGLSGLKAVLKEIRAKKGIHLSLIDDADMVIYGRGQTTHSPDEQKFAHAIMQWLDPGATVRPGNEFHVAISNYVGNLEEAVLGRLCEQHFTALGPQTDEEYANLFRLKLVGVAQYGLLKVRDWAGVGKLARETGLSGRDVKNIGVTLSGRSLNDAAVLTLPHRPAVDLVRKAIREHGVAIDDSRVIAEIGAYRSFKEAEAQRADAEATGRRIEEEYRDAWVRMEVKRRLRTRFPAGEPD